MQPLRRVAVIGGGISGLATAYFLQHHAAGRPPEVTLLEAGPCLGGKIATRSIAGVTTDVGPDTLTRRPELVELLDELRLTGAAVTPAHREVCILSRGRLRTLPSMADFGIPDRALPLVRSGLLSPAGVARAGLDLVLPRQSLPSDPSIGELLRPRFGDQFFDRLVAPLLGGMLAGSPDALSAASTLPDLHALAHDDRSLYLALRRRRRRRAAGGDAATAPRAVGLDGGLEQLVHKLARALEPATVLLSTPTVALAAADSGVRVTLGGPRPTTLDVDRVVLATPAFVTADLIEPLAAPVAAALRGVPYADVVSAVLAYPPAALERHRPIAGFLVPPAEGKLISGCTWVTAKWPQRGDPQSAVFRMIVTGERATALLELADDDVVTQLQREVSAALGVHEVPVQTLVRRLPKAIPQYAIGHAARLERIECARADLRGLYLTGAAFRGASVAACIAQARATAATVLADGVAAG